MIDDVWISYSCAEEVKTNARFASARCRSNVEEEFVERFIVFYGAETREESRTTYGVAWFECSQRSKVLDSK